MTTWAGTPEVYTILVARFAVFEKGIIIKAQIARLEVALARAGFCRDDLAVGNRHDYAIDIGKLMAGFVNTIIIRVPFEYKPLRRWFRLQYPGVQGGQVWVVVAVHRIHSGMQRRPIALVVLFNERLESDLIREFFMELFQIM